jgi:hypothetical protein
MYYNQCRYLHKQKLIIRIASSGMLRRVALVRTDVSEKRSDSLIRLTIVTGSPILVTLMEALSHSETSVLIRAPGLTSQKTPIFIATARKNFKFYKGTLRFLFNMFT